MNTILNSAVMGAIATRSDNAEIAATRFADSDASANEGKEFLILALTGCNYDEWNEIRTSFTAKYAAVRGVAAAAESVGKAWERAAKSTDLAKPKAPSAAATAMAAKRVAETVESLTAKSVAKAAEAAAATGAKKLELQAAALRAQEQADAKAKTAAASAAKDVAKAAKDAEKKVLEVAKVNPAIQALVAWANVDPANLAVLTGAMNAAVAARLAKAIGKASKPARASVKAQLQMAA